MFKEVNNIYLLYFPTFDLLLLNIPTLQKMSPFFPSNKTFIHTTCIIILVIKNILSHVLVTNRLHQSSSSLSADVLILRRIFSGPLKLSVKSFDTRSNQLMAGESYFFFFTAYLSICCSVHSLRSLQCSLQSPPPTPLGFPYF